MWLASERRDGAVTRVLRLSCVVTLRFNTQCTSSKLHRLLHHLIFIHFFLYSIRLIYFQWLYVNFVGVFHQWCVVAATHRSRLSNVNTTSSFICCFGRGWCFLIDTIVHLYAHVLFDIHLIKARTPHEFKWMFTTFNVSALCMGVFFVVVWIFGGCRWAFVSVTGLLLCEETRKQCFAHHNTLLEEMRHTLNEIITHYCIIRMKIVTAIMRVIQLHTLVPHAISERLKSWWVDWKLCDAMVTEYERKVWLMHTHKFISFALWIEIEYVSWVQYGSAINNQCDRQWKYPPMNISGKKSFFFCWNTEKKQKTDE